MIEIRYKCTCLKEEAALWLKPRGDSEDVTVFMGRVRDGITADHRLRSPLCLASKMEYAKVPAPTAGIGKRPR